MFRTAILLAAGASKQQTAASTKTSIFSNLVSRFTGKLKPQTKHSTPNTKPATLKSAIPKRMIPIKVNTITMTKMGVVRTAAEEYANTSTKADMEKWAGSWVRRINHQYVGAIASPNKAGSSPVERTEEYLFKEHGIMPSVKEQAIIKLHDKYLSLLAAERQFLEKKSGQSAENSEALSKKFEGLDEEEILELKAKEKERKHRKKQSQKAKKAQAMKQLEQSKEQTA